ncbi:hypothetical protein BDU57DRAFT_582438 [Ampelomyces quisqualis]|uniref:Uncharacterized protein n=1 Tax=Ampelomyces quisqualis TaxID=50730 RepID=A0A6A5Q9I3_AMPQU|nr:hypothetical protein BDU57DRAFT_582438 [Ampelomyces quisqualis]
MAGTNPGDFEILHREDTDGCNVYYATIQQIEAAYASGGLPDVSYFVISEASTARCRNQSNKLIRTLRRSYYQLLLGVSGVLEFLEQVELSQKSPDTIQYTDVFGMTWVQVLEAFKAYLSVMGLHGMTSPIPSTPSRSVASTNASPVPLGLDPRGPLHSEAALPTNHACPTLATSPNAPSRSTKDQQCNNIASRRRTSPLLAQLRNIASMQVTRGHNIVVRSMHKRESYLSSAIPSAPCPRVLALRTSRREIQRDSHRDHEDSIVRLRRRPHGRFRYETCFGDMRIEGVTSLCIVAGSVMDFTGPWGLRGLMHVAVRTWGGWVCRVVSWWHMLRDKGHGMMKWRMNKGLGMVGDAERIAVKGLSQEEGLPDARRLGMSVV